MKVAVIGGSVAGLEAAINLSQHFDVVVYEEHAEIGHPRRCAEGWIRTTGVQPYVEGRQIRKIEIWFLDSSCKTRRIRAFRTNEVEIIDRPAMERKMAAIARANGAKIVLGRRVGLSDCEADLIVDASGYPSQLYRESKRNRPNYAVACQYYSEYDPGDRMIFALHPALRGYFWIFPDSRSGSKIGAVSFSSHHSPKLKLDDFVRACRIKTEDYIAAPIGCYPNRPFVRKLGDSTIALVGDAAGVADRGFGEGMTKAVISSRIMAQCWTDGRIEEYERMFMKLMRWHYFLANLAAFLRDHNFTLRVLDAIGVTRILPRVFGVDKR